MSFEYEHSQPMSTCRQLTFTTTVLSAVGKFGILLKKDKSAGMGRSKG
jgi:hypothetical protein